MKKPNKQQKQAHKKNELPILDMDIANGVS